MSIGIKKIAKIQNNGNPPKPSKTNGVSNFGAFYLSLKPSAHTLHNQPTNTNNEEKSPLWNDDTLADSQEERQQHHRRHTCLPFQIASTRENGKKGSNEEKQAVAVGPCRSSREQEIGPDHVARCSTEEGPPCCTW